MSVRVARRSGKGRDALQVDWEVSGGPPRGQDSTPRRSGEVRRPPGGPGGVGRPSSRSKRGREALPQVREGS